MKRRRLFGPKAPLIAETVFKIGDTEIPVRGVPSGALPGALVVPGRDVPALHYRVQKAGAQQPLAVGAAQIGRVDRHSTCIQQGLEGLQPVRQFAAMVSCFLVSFVGYQGVLNIGY